MKKILLTCLSVGMVFAEATLTVSSIAATDDGFDIQIDYKSDFDIAGYQFTFLHEDALTITGAQAASGTDFQISAGSANSVVLGFSMTGAVLPQSGDYTPLCTLSVIVNNGASGNVVLDAEHKTDLGHTLLISDANACGSCCGVVDEDGQGVEGSCENNFHEAVWTVGSETFTLDNELVGPISFSLGNNYPNPFNPSTNIEFSIAEPSFVSLSIFDASGRLVKTLLSESKVADHYSVTWDGTSNNGINVSAGMYLYKINAGSFTETKKMLLVK